MVAPKRKTSKQRKHLRRSAVWKLDAPNLVVCPNCGEYTVSHRACKSCGEYKGRAVVRMKDDAKAK